MALISHDQQGLFADCCLASHSTVVDTRTTDRHDLWSHLAVRCSYPAESCKKIFAESPWLDLNTQPSIPESWENQNWEKGLWQSC